MGKSKIEKEQQPEVKAEETEAKKPEEVKETKEAKKPELPEPNPAGKWPDKGGFYWGTGRRKSSVARVRIRPGEGGLIVNKKEADDYFKRIQDRQAVRAPIKAVNAEGATSLGLARALKSYNEDYLQILRDGGYLTRDSRMVERKKPGQRGARRRFQFSKR